MDKAIKKAIEGGWKSPTKGAGNWIVHSVALLDPLFWQALGKSLGWNGEAWFTMHLKHGKSLDAVFADTGEEWQFYMHRFIDHLADGKDINSFFNELLK